MIYSSPFHADKDLNHEEHEEHEEDFLNFLRALRVLRGLKNLPLRYVFHLLPLINRSENKRS